MYGGKPYKQIGPEHGKNYTECVEYLRNYLEKRYTWLRSYWAPLAAKSLSEQLPNELGALSLERYDEEGLAALNDALSAGQKAVAGAKSYEEAQEAYQDAVGSLLDIPMREIIGDFNDDGEIVQKFTPEVLKDIHVEELSEFEFENLKDTLVQPFIQLRLGLPSRKKIHLR